MRRAWATSQRRQQLPPDWPKIRRQVERRAGGRCEWITNGTRCTDRGTDCDHIDDPDNHHPDNLRWLCGPHHTEHTLEQNAARRARLRLPVQPHPGVRTPGP